MYISRCLYHRMYIYSLWNVSHSLYRLSMWNILYKLRLLLLHIEQIAVKYHHGQRYNGLNVTNLKSNFITLTCNYDKKCANVVYSSICVPMRNL